MIFITQSYRGNNTQENSRYKSQESPVDKNTILLVYKYKLDKLSEVYYFSSIKDLPSLVSKKIHFKRKL